MRHAAWGEGVARILEAAIAAVEPGAAVARCLQRRGDTLSVAGQDADKEHLYDLRHIQRVFLVGAGKAGAPMAQAAAQVLGERLTQGLVVVKEGYAGETAFSSPVTILEAGHPLPDERGVQAAMRIQEMLSKTSANDLVIGLISGGGSALLVSPAPGVHLEQLQTLTSALLACGADIHEINTLRKHLEQLKGGGLARLAAPARMVTLILSDVIGDPLEVIASGPTVPDPSSYADALRILTKYALQAQVPQAILEHLQTGERGQIPETPKPGNSIFAKVNNTIIGNNMQAAQAALDQAQTEGFNTLLLTTFLEGEARHAGRALAAILRQVVASGQPLPRPTCMVAGGETTVNLLGDGLGGRNQELALGAVTDLVGLPDVALVTLATDGGDGPTDAAGAVVTGETLARALQSGLHPADFLARNDAYHFFDVLDDLLKPGPTRTNVNDLCFLFAF